MALAVTELQHAVLSYMWFERMLPSIAQLFDECKRPPGSLVNAMADLEDRGLIKVSKPHVDEGRYFFLTFEGVAWCRTHIKAPV